MTKRIESRNNKSATSLKKRKQHTIKLTGASFVRMNKQANKGKLKLLNKVRRKRNKGFLKKNMQGV